MVFSSFSISAGYPVKKKVINTPPSIEGVAENSKSTVGLEVTDNPLILLNRKLRGSLTEEFEYQRGFNPFWGIASFLAGVLCFFVYGLPLAICAIVFGALGMNKDLKGLAIAGFVLGCVALFIVSIFLFVLSA